MPLRLRLNATFLAVLAVSVMGTAIAAWAITFTSSHARLTEMATEFTALAGVNMVKTTDLVDDLLQNSSAIVEYILDLETQADVSRINVTQVQVLQTFEEMIAIVSHNAAQSESQLEGVITSVQGLIARIIDDEEAIAGQSAVELRYEFAVKAQTSFQYLLETRINALLRLPLILSYGITNPSKPVDAPIDDDDLKLLAALCAFVSELSYSDELAWMTENNRFYICMPNNFSFILNTTIDPLTNTCNQTYITWPPPPQLNSTINWLGYLRSTTPYPNPVGINCAYPLRCTPVCGYVPRCRPQYQAYLNLTSPQLLYTSVFIHQDLGVPIFSLMWGVINASATAPPMFEGVVGAPFFLSHIDEFLAQINLPSGTHMAVILDDPNMSIAGTRGIKCNASTASQTGPSGVPWFSVLRACDPRIQNMGSWIMQNRATLGAETSVVLNDTVWDIFHTTTQGLSYFVAVGMELSATYGALWASKANATQELADLSAAQLASLNASMTYTRAYMQSVQAQNLQQIQLMRTTLQAQLANLTVHTNALLNSSQAVSAAIVADMVQGQMRQVDEVRTAQLNALAVTTAWTIAVVGVLLLFVLLSSALGTTRLTASLTEIIALMEDVAEMRVENLEIPQDAEVVEVTRIQRAFRVLVGRLAEYKTYMPAALFNPVSETEDGSDGEEPAPKRTQSVSLATSSTPSSALEKAGLYIAQKMARRKVTVLVANVLQFRQFDTHPAVINKFAAYVKAVHDTASKVKGNVDCVVGDQILVTFNAYIPCGDPTSAAANVALDIQAAIQGSDSKFRIQIGLAAGLMLVGSTGYSRFKTMVALGTPTKVATLLAHLSQFNGGAILCDPSISERIKFTHVLRPVDLVHFVRDQPNPRSFAVHLLSAAKALQEDEWMYQLESSVDDWENAFQKAACALTEREANAVLQAYMELHPDNVWAERLKSRLPAWVPGLGLPLYDGSDQVRTGRPTSVFMEDREPTRAFSLGPHN